MATRGEQIRGLRDFFLDAFTASEFEMFLTVNGYREVALAVNQNVGSIAYFFDVVQEFDRRGLIDDAFFDQLRQERPRKGPQIMLYSNCGEARIRRSRSRRATRRQRTRRSRPRPSTG